jgi:hypothetical protein
VNDSTAVHFKELFDASGYRSRLAIYRQISWTFAHQGTTGIGSLDMQFIQAHLLADGISMDGFGDAGFSHIGELELRMPGRGTHRSTYPHSRFSVSSQPLHRANSCGRSMLLMKANTLPDMPFDASPNGAAMSETEQVHFS